MTTISRSRRTSSRTGKPFGYFVDSLLAATSRIGGSRRTDNSPVVRRRRLPK